MPFILLLMFVGLEIWGIVQMSERIGGAWVLAWLLGAAIFGGWLVAHGGLTAITRVRLAVARGELPTVDIFQGLITAFAGILFILPGFFTDLLAVSLLISGAGSVNRSTP